jgi:hypothetical protein
MLGDAKGLPESNGPLSFGNLTHVFEEVTNQTGAGLYVVKRLRSFLQKFSDIQNKFAKQLEEAASHEKAKLLAMKAGPDRMDTCYGAVVNFFAQMDSMIQTYKEFGEHLAMTCVDPLIKFHSVATNMLKESHQEVGRINTGLDEVRAEVHKNREFCRAALAKLNNRQASHLETKEREKSDQSKSPKGPVHSGWGDKIKSLGLTRSSSSTGKNLDKAREKAIRVCEQYQIVIKKAEQHQAHYYAFELPRVLKEMQRFEEMRLNQITSTLRKFCSLEENFSSNFQGISQALTRVGRVVDPESDVQTFITVKLTDHPPTPPIPFVYDMAFTPDDLRSESGASALFSTTLDAVMKYQEREFPDFREDVPRILDVLSQAVVTKGLHSEGIFRMSVGAQDLAHLRKKIERGDYDLKNVDPYAAAVLLKAWLRDLSEPLVPFEHYDECISIGSQPECDARAMTTLMAKLPPLNRRVAYRLCHMMKQISLPGNVEKNRMTLSNLAIVFAPCMLRSKVDDPARMLRDSKNACRWVERLVAVQADVFASEEATFMRRHSSSVKSPPPRRVSVSQEPRPSPPASPPLSPISPSVSPAASPAASPQTPSPPASAAPSPGSPPS